MKIAICDDEQEFVKKMAACLSRQPDCMTYCFHSPSTLLEQYETGNRYDVLFLDILMKPINGIALARKIRRYDESAVLVFLTAYLEYAPSGYEVNAFRYLLKPVTEEAVAKVLTEIRRNFPENRRILLRTPEYNMFLPIRNIRYLEIRNKETTLYCDRDTLVLRKGLSEFALELPPSLFFRIHRKYVVNLSHVREYDAAHLTLDCGKTLPIGRRRYQDFLIAMETYISGDENQ